MSITNGNRNLIDLKRWELCGSLPVSTQGFIISGRNAEQHQLWMRDLTTFLLYSPKYDGWTTLPTTTFGGTFGGGACGAAGSWSTGTTVGASYLTASAGTTTTITTNQTFARDLRGCLVHVVGGTNAGAVKTIASNTLTANGVITFTAAEGVAFDNTSQFRIQSPVYYVLMPSGGTFRKYDYATNTWTQLSTTGAPTITAASSTDAVMVSTPSWLDTGFQSFATGTATSGGASTVSNSGKAWTTNQWSNYQIRITGGTGTGQVRGIASNTGTQITVGSAWTTQPDNTSVYAIEGNDDYLYVVGFFTSTLYRYSISGNTWSTLTPTVARSVAPVNGMSAHWINAASDTGWSDESAIINGRRIYSFRGGATMSALDYYDVALNTWVNSVAYAAPNETLGGGTRYVARGSYIYIQKDSTGRWFRLNVVTGTVDGWGVLMFPQGTGSPGNLAFDAIYTDGATTLQWVYYMPSQSAYMLRAMVIE